MNPDASPLLLLVSAFLFLLGYLVGLRRGKDIGWLSKYFDDVARERARRNRLGQFKAKAN